MSKRALVPRATMCATCPFRDGSEYAFLRDDLAKSALSEASRICHSTGSRNAINHRPKQKKARACRGARDIQLRWLAAIGFLEAPTDAAWTKKWKEMNDERPLGRVRSRPD